MEAVSLTIVHRDPVCIDLRAGVGAARIERGRLALGRLLYKPIHLAAAGLIVLVQRDDQFDEGFINQLTPLSTIGENRTYEFTARFKHLALPSS